MQRLKYFALRFAQLIPMMFFATFITYLLMELAPGDTVSLMWINPEQMRVTPEKLEALKAQFGLAGPWYTRYFQWLWHLLQGNLGYSTISMRPIAWELSQRIGPTFLLVVVSQVITYIIGIVLGVVAAIKKNKLADKIISTVSYVIMSLPSAWVILLVLLLFVVNLGFPAFGLHSLTLKNPTSWEYFADTVKHLVLPVLCMVLTGVGSLVRIMRGSFLEVKNEDFVRTARSKGASERRVNFKHVFRNSSLLILSGFMRSLPMLVLQTTLIEGVFGIPGLGGYVYSAAANRDMPAAMISILLTSLLLMLGSIIADISMTFIDPRIGFSRKRWM